MFHTWRLTCSHSADPNAGSCTDIDFTNNQKRELSLIDSHGGPSKAKPAMMRRDAPNVPSKAFVEGDLLFVVDSGMSAHEE